MSPHFQLSPDQTKFFSPQGPIRHIILVVKRHRSFDQVFGDVHNANGDPSLAEFGKTITPNEHALATRYGMYDNFHTVGLDTGDDLNWVLGAYVSDYIERTLPAFLGARSWIADFQGRAKPAIPPNGYLWDDALDHGITLRNYGFFLSPPNYASRFPTYSGTNRLQTVTSTLYGADGDAEPATDQARLDVWEREFNEYVRTKTLPQLELIFLPGDQAIPIKITDRTPRANVADNDLAVGRLVEDLSHSPYWNDTALLIAEDDSQYGPDHVDSQRSILLVVSPYARPGVHHGWINLLSVVRTVELVLGLPNMTMNDGRAKPLVQSFQSAENTAPFVHLKENIDLDERPHVINAERR